MFIKLLTGAVLIKLLEPDPNSDPNQEQKFRIRQKSSDPLGFGSTTLDMIRFFNQPNILGLCWPFKFTLNSKEGIIPNRYHQTTRKIILNIVVIV